jgi:hypothetical protein
MSEQNNNMQILTNICTSKAEALKDGKVNGQQIKSINTTSVFMELTNQFGPMGKGWGYEILKDEMHQGVPILNANAQVICHEQVNTVVIALWYMLDGEKIVCPPQYGHTPFIMKTSYGPKTDFDPSKKSLSDAIKKSASMLGFNADVYLGEWDDVSVVELQAKQQEVKVEKREEKEASAFDNLCDEVKDAIENILPGIKSMRTLGQFKTKYLRKCSNEPALIQRINKEVNKRELEIKAAKEAAQSNQEEQSND